jgi:tetratricopeptide (TPR) repeat protein
MEDWILKGIISEGDEVASGGGGGWLPVQRNEDFRAWFTPGDPRCSRRESALAHRSRRRALDALTSRARVAALLGGTLVIVLAAVLCIQFKLTVVPHTWTDALSDSLSSLTDRFSRKIRHAANDVQVAPVREADLPGGDLLARIATSPVLQESPLLLFYRGRRLSLEEDPATRAEATRLLEQAFLGAPSDPRVIVALARHLDAMGRVEPSNGRDAMTLLARAEALAPNHPAVRAARCHLTFSATNSQPSFDIARTCLAADPGNLDCQHCQALALAAAGQRDAALATMRKVQNAGPHLPGAQLAFARMAIDALAYAEAASALDPFLRARPGSAKGHALRARLAWLTSDWARALQEARRAAELDPDDLDNLLHAGRLALALSGAEAALGPSAKLVGHPGLKNFEAQREAWLLRSQALVGAGRGAEAAEAARASLEASEDWAPGILATAQARMLLGDTAAVESTIRSTTVHDLSRDESARYLVGSAQLYQKLGRDKAAVAFYESAVEADPSNVEARIGLAGILLKMSSVDKALANLRALAEFDFQQVSTHPPYRLCVIGRPPFEEIRTAFEAAAKKDIRYRESLPFAQGVLAYHAGDLERAETRLREALKMNDGDDEARAYLGRLLLARHRDLEAQEIFARLSVSRGKVGVYSLLNGEALARASRDEEASRAFDQAYQSIRDWPGARRRRAAALFRAKDFTSAWAELDEAIRLDPLDHTARRLILEHGASRGAKP